MTATAHAIIGIVIAAKVGDPAIAIPIAIASHIVADAIPHWDMATSRKQKGKAKVMQDATADVILGFTLSFVLLKLLFPHVDVLYAFIIIIAAQSLDWIMTPYYFWKIDFPPFVWAYKFQKKIEHRLDKPWGIITQVVPLTLLLLWAKFF